MRTIVKILLFLKDLVWVPLWSPVSSLLFQGPIMFYWFCQLYVDLINKLIPPSDLNNTRQSLAPAVAPLEMVFYTVLISEISLSLMIGWLALMGVSTLGLLGPFVLLAGITLIKFVIMSVLCYSSAIEDNITRFGYISLDIGTTRSENISIYFVIYSIYFLITFVLGLCLKSLFPALGLVGMMIGGSSLLMVESAYVMLNRYLRVYFIEELPSRFKRFLWSFIIIIASLIIAALGLILISIVTLINTIVSFFMGFYRVIFLEKDSPSYHNKQKIVVTHFIRYMSTIFASPAPIHNSLYDFLLSLIAQGLARKRMFADIIKKVALSEKYSTYSQESALTQKEKRQIVTYEYAEEKTELHKNLIKYFNQYNKILTETDCSITGTQGVELTNPALLIRVKAKKIDDAQEKFTWIYETESLKRWLQDHSTHPETRESINNFALAPINLDENEKDPVTRLEQGLIQSIPMQEVLRNIRLTLQKMEAQPLQNPRNCLSFLKSFF